HMTREEFRALKEQVDARLPPQVQALALAWVRPFRVDCASITTAFAFGFSPLDCAEGCHPTALSRYFNTDNRAPFTELQMRPAMLLAATTIEQARALIDRGIAADGTFPKGTAYLLDTSDTARNVRARRYPMVRWAAGERLRIETIKSDDLRG